MSKERKIQDLINNPSFINWANNTNAADIKYWNDWAISNGGRRELLEDAKMMIKGLPFNKSTIPETTINASWAEMEAMIQQAPVTQIVEGKKEVLSKKWYWLLAAIVLLSLVYYVHNSSNSQSEAVWIALQTDANSTESFDLPDGSTVTLNTNSKLSYQQDYLSQKQRTLHLEGEAFFDIVKQKELRELIVKTDDIDITVIGTEFNVNDKRGAAIVSLYEGVVNLGVVDGTKKTLEAGQTAFYDNNQGLYIIEEGMSDFWRSWIAQKWSFGSGMKMEEICKRIEETYRIKCQIKDASILEKIAAGEVSVANKELLFQALSVLLDLDFTEQNGQIIISER